MVKLKNVSQRWHIDVNMPHKTRTVRDNKTIIVERGKRFKLFAHNEAVEVPDEALEMDFVRDLLADGSLMIIEQSSSLTSEPESLMKLTKNELVSLAEIQDVSIESTWTKSEIVDALTN